MKLLSLLDNSKLQKFTNFLPAICYSSESRKCFIINEIRYKPQTATELKRGTKLPLTNVSRVLIQFARRGLAECLTPNETRSRVYQLTARGNAVREEILKRG